MNADSFHSIHGCKRKQADKLDSNVCTLMDSLSLCRHAPLKHTACMWYNHFLSHSPVITLFLLFCLVYLHTSSVCNPSPTHTHTRTCLSNSCVQYMHIHTYLRNMTALSYSSVLVIEVKPGCEMQIVCVKATA